MERTLLPDPLVFASLGIVVVFPFGLGLRGKPSPSCNASEALPNLVNLFWNTAVARDATVEGAGHRGLRCATDDHPYSGGLLPLLAVRSAHPLPATDEIDLGDRGHRLV